MNKKTLWIIQQSASTPEIGYAGRWYYLSKYLARLGYEVYLIAASYTHVMRKPPVVSGDYAVEQIADNFNIVWVKTLHYKNGLDKKRILNWFLFAYRLLNLPKYINKKPDIIISSSPSIVSSWSAEKISKKYNSKLIFDVRDIWPLILRENGGYSKFNPLIMLFQYLEDRAYFKSDYILSPLGKLDLHIKNRNQDSSKFRWFANGIDIEELSISEPISNEIISKIPKDKFIVGYTGTLCLENNLDCLIKAAKILKDYSNNICFVIVGDGVLKQSTIEKTKNLNNFIFIDSLPKKQIQSILQLFDACYTTGPLNQSREFGLASLKHPEYLFSGKPMIYNNFGYIGENVESYGVSAMAQNHIELAEAILRLYNMEKEDRLKLGQNGKNYALEKYDYSKIALKLDKFLDEISI